MIALLLGLALLSPAQAAGVAARLGGEDADHLRAIAWRESRLQRVGVHRGRNRGQAAWGKAARVGLLSPSWCPFHQLGPEPRAWGTRGSWGHLAAYAVPYLGCVPPWVLDVPIVSAWVAVLRLRVSREPGAPRALREWAEVKKRAAPGSRIQGRPSGVEGARLRSTPRLLREAEDSLPRSEAS